MSDFKAQYTEHVEAFLQATHDAWMADRHRRAVRYELARNLVGTNNPATGRVHSATSAMEAAEADPAYQDAVQAAHLAELDRMRAEEQLRCLRLQWMEAVRGVA